MNYAGIGSRKTPPEIQTRMTYFAEMMYLGGHILRSGGALGADQAFELGSQDRKEIYRPEHATPESLIIAEQFHPNWKNLSPYVRNLMGRNVMIILGHLLNDPVAFVMCWTPDGCTNIKTRTPKTGGTGQAIAVASSYNIPVYNLKNYTLLTPSTIDQFYKQILDTYKQHN